MKSMRLMPLALLAALAAAGCHTIVDPVDDAPFPNTLNSTVILQDCLADRVLVHSERYERTPNNTFLVTCSFKNLTDRPITMKARTQYLDADRRPEEGPDAWQLVHLPPLAIDTYQSRSTGDGVSYYFVEVLEEDRKH